MNKEAAAKEIIRIAQRMDIATGDWAMVTTVAEQLDVIPSELAEGFKHLARTGVLVLAPESNQRMLTEMNHLYAVRMGCQDLHIFTWA